MIGVVVVFLVRDAVAPRSGQYFFCGVRQNASHCAQWRSEMLFRGALLCKNLTRNVLLCGVLFRPCYAAPWFLFFLSRLTYLPILEPTKPGVFHLENGAIQPSRSGGKANSQVAGVKEAVGDLLLSLPACCSKKLTIQKWRHHVHGVVLLRIYLDCRIKNFGRCSWPSGEAPNFEKILQLFPVLR